VSCGRRTDWPTPSERDSEEEKKSTKAKKHQQMSHAGSRAEKLLALLDRARRGLSGQRRSRPKKLSKARGREGDKKLQRCRRTAMKRKESWRGEITTKKQSPGRSKQKPKGDSPAKKDASDVFGTGRTLRKRKRKEKGDWQKTAGSFAGTPFVPDLDVEGTCCKTDDVGGRLEGNQRSVETPIGGTQKKKDPTVKRKGPPRYSEPERSLGYATRKEGER